MRKLERLRPANVFFRICNTIIMLIVAVVTIYPFIYMLMLSLSSGSTYAKLLIWPIGITSKAYELVFTKIKFMDGFFISFGRSTLGPICTVLIIFMGAYVLSRQDLLFRKFFSRYVIFAMYFSAGILPVYMNISQLKLTGSFWVYILPNLVNVFELILIRTFIQEMPRSLEESAVIDGANDFQVAFKVVLPLCLPVLAAVILFEFVNQWNMYADTLLYNATKPNLFTLQYILTNYLKMQQVFSATELATKGQNGMVTSDVLKMAMTVIVCIPIAIVYPFLQKYFVKGLLVGSIKG